jgi:hypothetical protein
MKAQSSKLKAERAGVEYSELQGEFARALIVDAT